METSKVDIADQREALVVSHTTKRDADNQKLIKEETAESTRGLLKTQTKNPIFYKPGLIDDFVLGLVNKQQNK